MIEVAEIVLHKADEPYFIGNLRDADVLAGEDIAVVDLLPVEADAPAANPMMASLAFGVAVV